MVPLMTPYVNGEPNWLGLITRKLVTEDYVPLLPWLGVMWWGVAGAGCGAASGKSSIKRAGVLRIGANTKSLARAG